MASVFFDTSALVPVVTQQLPNHPVAHARFVSEINSGHSLVCSTHTLAECYATLTALPLAQRITGLEAARLIEVNFVQKMEVIALNAEDYTAAIRLCSDRARISGLVYDALHLIAALKSNCSALLTYNLKHFDGLAPQDFMVRSP